ncbi:MAG: hypothetical protein N0C90_20900, partial [Candidatus Thiodiazotropha endolucinida]|nr:hypothetical protein [Candidatus Thiodiazotropha taylori]MCW4263812.1 hypothetical protein [Candidatus Thiodiazotropha endolucinida]
MDLSSSGKSYKIFKDNFKMNDYFSYLSNKQSRILAAYRTRNHRLPIETGRWTSTPLKERLCKLCNSDVGDEFHYVMQCKYFSDIRRKFLKPYYTTNVNTIKFNELMNHKSKKVIRRLCLFIE